MSAKRRSLITFAALAGLAAMLPAAGMAQSGYPDRPITLIVPWGAGGGTDATARIIGSVLEKELGQPINVVNRTGGSGVVGHSAIATAEPDGYTLGLATVEIGMMHWQGLTDLTWEDYTPLALMNEDPASVNVAADAPYEGVEDLLAEIKANPGSMSASGTGQGGIWHLALAGMLNDAGIAPSAVRWVPSEGAAPGLQDLVAGGVEIAPVSLPEARSLIDAGRVKPLAIMAQSRSALYPDVPTLKEATGSDWTLGAWRGVVAPKGLPEAVADRLIPALQTVFDSAEFKDFMAKQGYGTRWAAGQDFAAFMAQSNESLGSVMKDVGIAR